MGLVQVGLHIQIVGRRQRLASGIELHPLDITAVRRHLHRLLSG